MQIKVETSDFTPTLAETEAVKAKLRGDLYKKVNEALTQLNQAETDRKYRIGSLNITASGDLSGWTIYPPLAGQSAGRLGPQDKQAGAIERSQKVILTGQVTFAVMAPRE
jgi:hypothetical protein